MLKCIQDIPNSLPDKTKDRKFDIKGISCIAYSHKEMVEATPMEGNNTMKKMAQKILLGAFVFLMDPAAHLHPDSHKYMCYGADTRLIDRTMREELQTLRDKTVVDLVSSNMEGHRWCMKANSVLNTMSQTCVASAIFASSCAGYWKQPAVAFAASGIGVAGITLRGIADYAKKQGKEKLNRASALLREEGVRGLDDYMRADSSGNVSIHIPTPLPHAGDSRTSHPEAAEFRTSHEDAKASDS